MDIPYTVEARPDTGVYNAKVGMWLFLASEVMLFGGLFSSYILLRVGAPAGTWPSGLLSVPLGTINTIILALSAITTLMAWVACKSRMFERFKLFQGLTILLAIIFLCVKSYEYRDKLTHYEVVLKSGEIADGHLIRREPSGDIVLHGHVVKEHAELMNGRKHVEHRELTIAKDQIVRMQNYGPWHNTFLAIYFTMSGLHALHILGGLVVMGYLWGPGSRMWKTDPDRFTNRVEVSGLFWHFVDLVWIFLFPTLYLI
ncbi:MAG: heme-copper oxidase subunit III [Verrucomicrobiota bacterium]|jgi:cytochrome c oxidase subunit 3|nr:heme-copper oxidase subunit III [Verrucomicrobiota bacterium]